MAPDIMRVGDPNYASYVTLGALENLDPYIDMQPDWNADDFLAGPYDVYKMDGSLWAVLDCIVGRGLFYN